MDRTRLTTTLGATVMELVDKLVDLAEKHELEDIEFGITGIVVEVKATREGHQGTGIMVQCSDARAWIQQGLFTAAAQTPMGEYE